VTTPIRPSRKSAPRIQGAAERCVFVVVSVLTASLRAAAASAALAGGIALGAAASAPVPAAGGGGFELPESGFTLAAPAPSGLDAEGEELDGAGAGCVSIDCFSCFFVCDFGAVPFTLLEEERFVVVADSWLTGG